MNSYIDMQRFSYRGQHAAVSGVLTELEICNDPEKDLQRDNGTSNSTCNLPFFKQGSSKTANLTQVSFCPRNPCIAATDLHMQQFHCSTPIQNY